MSVHNTTTTRQRCRLRLKSDGTRAETRFRQSAKWTSLFKSAGASVQSTTRSRGVGISGCNAGYTMFRGSVNSTGYPLHSPVSPSLPLPCVTVCHHISTGLYIMYIRIGVNNTSCQTTVTVLQQHLLGGKRQCQFQGDGTMAN
jgi:hypothetical protein